MLSAQLEGRNRFLTEKHHQDADSLRKPRLDSGQLIVAAAPAQRVVYLEPAHNTNFRNRPPSPSELLYALRSHGILLAVLGVLGILAGIFYAFWQEPLYQTKTAIAVQAHFEPPPTVRLGDSEGTTEASNPESYLETQALILQSKSLRLATVSRLRNQNKQWNFTPTDRFLIIRTKLRRRASKPKPGLPTVTTQVKVLESAGAIEITTISSNPQFAAAYANVLVQEYIDSQMASSLTAAKRNLQWMMLQLDNLKEKLQTAENGLQSYGHAAGVIITPEQSNGGSDQLSQVQEALSKAEVDRMMKESAYEVAGSSPIESLPQVINNDRISEYESKLADLRRELAEMRVQFTPEYYKVVRIQAQINEIEAALKRERQSILDGIHDEYRAALKREDLLKSAYASEEQQALDRTEKAIKYDIQKHEVESLRGLYDELLKKAQSGLVMSAAHGDWIRVIDPADPPAAPFKPNLPKSVGMGWALFTFSGVFVVIGRRFVRSEFMAPGESATRLSIPELAAIPDLRSLAARRTLRLKNGIWAEPKEYESERSITNWGYRPTIAEAYRGAVASLVGSKSHDKEIQVILGTSAQRGEGKSSTMTNLGIALAEIGRKTLLIDADLRKPRLHEIFDISNNWGLSTILSEQTAIGEMPIESLVRATDVPNLSLLTSGPGVVNISNLFYSGRADELIWRLRKEFEIILIDTPPVIGLADARMISRLVDGAILILRAGSTTVGTAVIAKEQLEKDGVRLIGSVLNGWDVRSAGPYSYYYADHYYG